MQDVRIICPGCTKRLRLGEPVAPGDRLRCPKCTHTFNVQSHDIVPATSNGGGRPTTAPVFVLEDVAPKPQRAVQVAPLPVAVLEPAPAEEPAAPSQGNGRVVLLVGGAAILLLGLGIGLAIALS